MSKGPSVLRVPRFCAVVKDELLANITRNALETKFIPRDTFPHIAESSYQWYPGHMAKALRKISERLFHIDIILEVCDSRLPLSGRNSLLSGMASGRPCLTIFNKCDLLPTRYGPASGESQLRKVLFDEGLSYENFVFISQNKKFYINNIRKSIKSMIDDPLGISSERSYRILVVGLPNVGKSTILNSLRTLYSKKGKVAKTGPLPGVTRAIDSEVLIGKHPNLYLSDCPGIMPTKVESPEIGLKLSLVGCLQDNFIPETILVDYLLFELNTRYHFDYVTHFKMHQPTNDGKEFLSHVARIRGQLLSKGVLDVNNAAKIILREHREGKFGKMLLDDNSLSYSHHSDPTSWKNNIDSLYEQYLFDLKTQMVASREKSPR